MSTDRPVEIFDTFGSDRLPTHDEMTLCEELFYARCQLDKNGNRTNIPREMPNDNWLDRTHYNKKRARKNERKR